MTVLATCRSALRGGQETALKPVRTQQNGTLPAPAPLPAGPGRAGRRRGPIPGGAAPDPRAVSFLPTPCWRPPRRAGAGTTPRPGRRPALPPRPAGGPPPPDGPRRVTGGGRRAGRLPPAPAEVGAGRTKAAPALPTRRHRLATRPRGARELRGHRTPGPCAAAQPAAFSASGRDSSSAQPSAGAQVSRRGAPAPPAAPSLSAARPWAAVVRPPGGTVSAGSVAPTFFRAARGSRAPRASAGRGQGGAAGKASSASRGLRRHRRTRSRPSLPRLP